MSLIKYAIDCSELGSEEFNKLDKFLDGLDFLWQKDIRNPRCGILHLNETINIESLNLPDRCHYSRVQ